MGKAYRLGRLFCRARFVAGAVGEWNDGVGTEGESGAEGNVEA